MNPEELWWTAGRALAVYVLLLFVIRLLGKRTIGNFAAFDLLVALMLGELVDEIIYGDVAFWQGGLAIAVIAGAEAGNSWLTWWHRGLARVLEGSPTVIVRDGSMDERGMRAERMNPPEVMGHLRSHGVRDLREVALAVVEDDGTVSVIRRTWAEAATRADVDAAAAALRTKDRKDVSDPRGPHQTDASEWLT